MATYKSKPFSTIFRGKIYVPDKFIVNYKGTGDLNATIQFKGILESGLTQNLSSAIALNSRIRDSKIIDVVYAAIVGFYYEIANSEALDEMFGVTLVTKQNQSITYGA